MLRGVNVSDTEYGGFEGQNELLGNVLGGVH